MKKKIFVIATVFILLATLPVMADNTDNHPPAKPTITGPSSGKAGETYTYTATTIDPDGDKIFYCFDWGDGNEFCSNYVNSGESIDAQHSWSSKGTYTVKVIATDEHGAKSEPATLTVSMPLVKPLFNKFRIITPRNGIYIFGVRVMPIIGRIIIGNVNVRVAAPDYITKVEFYLPLTCGCGLKLTHIDTQPPFEWKWNVDYDNKEVKDFGFTEIIARGYDKDYNGVSDSVLVYKVD